MRALFILLVLGIALLAPAQPPPPPSAPGPRPPINTQAAAAAISAFQDDLLTLAMQFNRMQTALGASGLGGPGAVAVNNDLLNITAGLSIIQNATSSLSELVLLSGAAQDGRGGGGFPPPPPPPPEAA